MQRYFVDKMKNNTFQLKEDDSYHFQKVMRGNLDETVEIVYKEELYLCKVIGLNPCTVEIIKKEEEKENKFHVDIAQALVKEQKMDLILQKSTELGVENIIPLITERSIVKLDKKSDKKIDRWNAIVEGASKQSKRLTIPRVSQIKTISDLTKLDYDYRVLCSVNEMSKNIKKVLANVNSSDRILFVIGPEGGFTKEEEDTLIASGFISVSLGNNVLRTETTSLFLLSVVGYHFMR